MPISYPLALPTTRGLANIVFGHRPTVGETRSDFTGAQQTYDWGGDIWLVQARLPPMKRADAEAWVNWRLALNGKAGSFLLGDPVNTSPRGTWAGTPLVKGSHAARAVSITMDGFTPGATVKAGDWFQIGSGSSARLYKVLQDATADGGGELTLDITPKLRAALADNTALVTSSPKGLFRLRDNLSEWSIGLGQIYGLEFAAVEDLRGI